jgi:hypothetical protein
VIDVRGGRADMAVEVRLVEKLIVDWDEGPDALVLKLLNPPPPRAPPLLNIGWLSRVPKHVRYRSDR